MKPVSVKSTTECDWRRRVARVVEHVADRLDEPLDLERLAAVACFSPFHFHRIYTAVSGETLADTVRRLRLHRAAGELCDDRLPLERIATRAGYGSLAAFSRAFKTAHGLPPARFRAERRPPTTFGPTEDSTTMNTIALPVEIRTAPRLRLAVVPHVGSYMEIERAFARLSMQAGPAGLFGPTSRLVGVYFDDPAAVPTAELRSEAGLTVADEAELPEGLAERVIPAGRVAVTLHRGPYADLHATYTRLYREWLPKSGEEPADLPCLEVYLDDPRTTAPKDLRTEIHLPLRD